MKVKSFNSSGYANGREHLAAELLKLDVLIHMQVLRFRALHRRKGDAFAGLYIGEEEVDTVMAKGPESREPHQPEPLKKKLETIKKRISNTAENSVKQGIRLPFHQLGRFFQLSSFDHDIILVCLAPELDKKYERLYAYLQGDVTKKFPTVDLILDLLCDTPEQRTDARASFFPGAPLFKYELIAYLDDAQLKPLIARGLKPDDRVVNFLLEQNVIDPELSSFAKIIKPYRDWSSVITEDNIDERLNRLLEECFKRKERGGLVFYLKGPYGAGKKLTAEAFCYGQGLLLIWVDMREFLTGNRGLNVEKIAKRLFRETLFLPAVIYLENFDLLFSGAQQENHFRKVIVRVIEEFSFITFLSGEKSWPPPREIRKHSFLEIEFPVPSYDMRKRMWEKVLGEGYSLSPGISIDSLANKFRFTGGQIRDAAAEARNLSIMRGTFNKNGIIKEDLYRACRAQSNHLLSEMARKINPKYTWSDIVLPADKLQHLKEIRNHVKYRQVIYRNWGFDRKLALGKGLNILFSGPSGTGKTMAADVIANELGIDYYKIDLSCVVSKYIGETEKNLAGIFKEAETANGILFFDEADALFGKRSEVKDSHDRYANIETGYLLQKMEEYEGVVILATNMRKNMDDAFVRRMHFTVEFPFPGEDSRLRIWENIFPPETPLDESVDFDFLPRQFRIAGGNIRNIALAAAFFAADDGGAVTMEHILRACKREFQKMGKSCVKADFGKYYEVLQRLEG